MKDKNYVAFEIRKSKGIAGTLRKHRTDLGLHTSDFSTRTDYQRAVKAQHKYREGEETRKILKEQVNGTIFAAGYDAGEGDLVTYQEGDIL